MRATWRLALALCLTIIPIIRAELSQEALLHELPSCALDCLSSISSNGPCLPTNKTCTCTNNDYRIEMTQCVIMMCTVKESLTTKNLTNSFCDVPIRDISREHVILSNVIGSIGCFCILQRLAFKVFYGLGLAADDWVMLISGLSGVPALLMNQYGVVANGLGRDIWNVPFDQITRFGIWFYILMLTYFGQVALQKMALLLFYLRIFSSPSTRRILWATIVLCVAIGLLFMFVAAFQCTPISYFWTKWDNEHWGHCLNLNTISWSNAIIGITLDVWLIFIPLWSLRKLNLDWKRKIGVGLMFAVGIFVSIVSIVRLWTIVHYGDTQDHTWDYVLITRWSIIEIAVGQICACMPSLRIAFLRLFPRFQEPPKPPQQQRYRNSVPVLNLAYFGKNRVITNMSRVETGIGSRWVRSTEIVCERTFEITIIDVNDETELVQVQDLDAKSNRSEYTIE